MKVLMTGARGLIGTAIVEALEARGDTVTRLVRRAARGPGEVSWDPAGGTIDKAGLEGHDAVVHLAGESIFGLWTSAKKRRIRESRVQGTSLLAGAVAGLEAPPAVFVSASAIGYYGDRGDEVLTESEGPGQGFLAEVVRDWEAAAQPARDAGIRVVNMRNGIVMAEHGGALQVMLIPFKLGLGGKLGSGQQWFSWVSLPDLVDMYLYALDTESLAGAVNGTAPEPVTNEHLTRALAQAVHRPAFFSVPAFAARTVMGELSGELLGSIRVVPARLQQEGFSFSLPEIEVALRHELGS